MKTKEILIKIFIVFSFVIIISIAVLGLLGIKEKVGFLSDFNLNIDKTLYINGLDINETKKLFTLDDKLDYNSITNYIFTNDSITNYSYDFRIKYYSKVFRNSDIYDVYPNIENILNNNNFIKEIKMGEKGSPFGDFISSKIIYTEKIDNIKYNLKLKGYFILLTVIFTFIFFLFLCLMFYLKERICKILLLIYSRIYYLFLFIYNNINNNKNNANIPIIVFIIFFPFVFLFYWNVSSSMPYYYAWDSSLIFSSDILLSYINIVPGHMLHPNLVSLVLYKWIFLPIGVFFNIISPINLQTFQSSLNPYMYLIDISEYIFNVNTIIMFLFITIMYINIIKIFKIVNITNNRVKIFLFSISILIILSFSTFMTNSIIYQIVVIRYDSIAFLLGSISLYFIVLSSETNTCYEKKHIFYIFLSSLFIGAALLSKFQMASWLFILFFIYVVLNIDKFNSSTKIINYKIAYNLLYIDVIILIIINIIICYLFYNKRILATIFLYDINFHYILIISNLVNIFFILLSVFTILVRKNKINISNSLKIILNNFIYYILISFLPILSAFLLPKGLDIFFNVWIMVYDGGVLFLSLFKWNWENSPYSSYGKNVIIMGAVITLIVIIMFIYFFKYKKLIKNKISNTNLLKILLSIFLLVISLFLLKGLRISSNKDLIIAATIILISLLMFIKTIILYLSNCKKIVLNIFIFILFILSLKYILNIYKNDFDFIGFNDNTYFYNLEYWKTYINAYNYDPTLQKIMDNTYTNDNIWNSLFFWSKNTKNIKNLLKQINIKNNQIYNTIIAEQGSFISNNKAESITFIDKYISGGLMLPIYDETKFLVFARSDYDFYFISDIEIKVMNNNEIEFIDYDFYINNNKYFVYKIKTGHFFSKGEDFMNRCFVLINDKLAKGL